jgi:hypothetical protein
VTQWGWKRWVVAMGGAGAVALAIGLPTEIIPNPWFHRMIPVEWWNAPVLAATAMLSGLLLATYVRDDRTQVEREPSSTRGGLGGVLAFFAVGCPVCNKLVVVALGTSGAMSWFAPAQPFLAAGALVLLATALRGRLRGERACRIPAGETVSDASRAG